MPKAKKKRMSYTRTSQKLKIPSPKKPKRTDRSQAVYEYDTVFSWMIRLMYANDKGVCECYTCGKKALRRQLQNGHRITRGCYKYRRDLKNCRIQCQICNIFKSGNYIVYTMKMVKEDQERAENAMIQKKEVHTIKTWEIKEKILECEETILQLLEDKQIDGVYILK